jgi:ferredoxin
MKIVVDEKLCIGCGACVDAADGYFKLEGDVSEVAKAYDEADRDLIDEKIAGCPTGAISLE